MILQLDPTQPPRACQATSPKPARLEMPDGSYRTISALRVSLIRTEADFQREALREFEAWHAEKTAEERGLKMLFDTRLRHLPDVHYCEPPAELVSNEVAALVIAD